MIDKDSLNSVIFMTRKNEFLDHSIVSRVYETGKHKLELSKDLNFSNFNAQNLQTTINSNIDHIGFEDNHINEDIYLTISSSQIYKYLIDKIKIPTNQEVDDNTLDLYECVIHTKEANNFNKNRNALNFLAFINLDLDKKCLITADIYNYIIEKFDELSISDQKIVKCPIKSLVLDKIDNDYSMLSATKQNRFRIAGFSVLSYKNLNPERMDDSNIDALQYHLIDQQMRFNIYLSLTTIFLSVYIRFNRQKMLVDATGNLFFRFSLPPTPIYKNIKVDFKNLFFNCLDYGILLSLPNLEGKISISKENTLENITTLSTGQNANIIEPNPLYSILFVLLSIKNSDAMNQIDNYILNQNYEEVDNVLKDIFC